MASDQPLTDKERTLPAHLGGHFGNTNVDAATLRYLVERFGVQSFLDVGCGPGGMLDEARALGLHAVGVDGDSTLDRDDVIVHDYTRGPFPASGWGLVWSVEFVEHVAAEYIPNFLATFRGGRVLLLTAAPPGFPGHHHVNCQPASYWIDLLQRDGWTLDLEGTAWVRENGAHPFTHRQGLVFVRS